MSSIFMKPLREPAQEKPLVLIDVDGVLADCLTPMCEILSNIANKKILSDDIIVPDIYSVISKEHKQEFTDRWCKEDFCSNIVPFMGAVEGVRNLRKHADIHIVTAPAVASRTWVNERTTWCKRYFDIDPVHEITHTASKYLMRGNMFIDDVGKNIIDWCKNNPNGIGVVWACNRNKDFDDLSLRKKYRYVRTNDWNDVINLVYLL